MQNGIIKGNGASRYLKTIPNASTLYPTYEDFILALTQGTFTIDFNGINESGWSQIGTELNKANLLSDETCALLELDATESVPDDALQSLYSIASDPGVQIATGSFTVTPKNGVAGKYTLTHNLGVKPKLIVIGNADSTAYRSLTLIDGNGNHSNSFGKAFCYGVDFYATNNPAQAAVTVSENDIIFSYKCEQSSYAKTTIIQYTLIY